MCGCCFECETVFFFISLFSEIVYWFHFALAGYFVCLTQFIFHCGTQNDELSIYIFIFPCRSFYWYISSNFSLRSRCSFARCSGARLTIHILLWPILKPSFLKVTFISIRFGLFSGCIRFLSSSSFGYLFIYLFSCCLFSFSLIIVHGVSAHIDACVMRMYVYKSLRVRSIWRDGNNSMPQKINVCVNLYGNEWFVQKIGPIFRSFYLDWSKLVSHKIGTFTFQLTFTFAQWKATNDSVECWRCCCFFFYFMRTPYTYAQTHAGLWQAANDSIQSVSQQTFIEMLEETLSQCVTLCIGKAHVNRATSFPDFLFSLSHSASPTFARCYSHAHILYSHFKCGFITLGVLFIFVVFLFFFLFISSRPV